MTPPGALLFALVATALSAGCRERTPPAAEMAPEPLPEAAPAPPAAPSEAGLEASAAASSIEGGRDRDRVRVKASTSFRCSNPSVPNGVDAAPRPHGVRVTVRGQGPCPGETDGWEAKATARFLAVQSTGGKPSRCLCHGTGTFDIDGLSPGTWRVQIAGGFNRSVSIETTIR